MNTITGQIRAQISDEISYLSKNSHIPTISNKDDDQSKADILNNYFATAASELESHIPPCEVNIPDPPAYPPVFEFNEFTECNVAEAIRDMKPSTSCGVDGFTARIVKAAGPTLIKPLTHIFNLSISKGIFPHQWKVGSITPLFKDGDTSSPSNYRPIPIIPIFGKILEHLIHSQLYKFYTNRNFFSACQAGFRKGYSTGTCLTDFLNEIYSNMDNRIPSGVLFLDLSKAFDMVNFEIMLHKLRLSGLKASTTRWFRSYLCSRSHVMKVRNSKSSQADVTCGVPQGSILGPLLFTAYINDLPECIPEVKVNLYADDTAITVSFKDPIEMEGKLNKSINRLSSWFSKNKLSLNIKKSKLMLFGTQSQIEKLGNLVVQHNNSPLEQVDSFIYLGVKLDPQLNFHMHCEYIRSKTFGKIRTLGQTRNFLDINTSLMLYRSLVLPLFEYCDHIFNCISQKDSLMLEKLQNTCLRNILGRPKSSSATEMRAELKQDSLALHREFHTANEMYKIVNNMAPDEICSLFTVNNIEHNFTLRSATRNDLVVPRCKLECGKRNFRHRGAIIWNSIPLPLHNEQTLKAFKKVVLAYLRSKYNVPIL